VIAGTTPPPEIPAETLDRLKGGDLAALADVYPAVRAPLWRYLVHMTGDPMLADEMVSRVFMNAIRAIHSGNTWDATFEGWLYRIAHNLAIDYRRQRGRRPLASLSNSITDPDADPAGKAERVRTRERLERAMVNLPGHQADILRLRFLADLPHGEVAAVLGITPAASKTGQHRALGKMRELLTAEAG
jgi:RNA polymerase sigma-70 factor (ECF subfamily)